MKANIGIADRAFIDYYDACIPSRADISLSRSVYSHILSRPNLFSFLAHKLKLTPVPSFRLDDRHIDKLLDSTHLQPWVAYYDEQVHSGAGMRLILPSELVDSPTQAQSLKMLDDTFVADFIPTTTDFNSGSVATTYFKIGKLEYWVEYCSDTWQSSYPVAGTTRVLPQAEVDAYWPEQAGAIAKARGTLAKIPILSIDFLRDIRDDKVYACDFNLAPRIGDTAIANVLNGADCWAEISRYINEHIESIYDYLLVANTLPAEFTAPGFALDRLTQLRYLPAGTFWQCREDKTIWKYLQGEKDSERFFWKQKTSYGQAGIDRLDRKEIFNGRTYRKA